MERSLERYFARPEGAKLVLHCLPISPYHGIPVPLLKMTLRARSDRGKVRYDSSKVDNFYGRRQSGRVHGAAWNDSTNIECA
jgi:hypothetical protein